MMFLLAVITAFLIGVVLFPLWVLCTALWAAHPKDRPAVLLLIFLILWFLFQVGK